MDIYFDPHYIIHVSYIIHEKSVVFWYTTGESLLLVNAYVSSMKCMPPSYIFLVEKTCIHVWPINTFWLFESHLKLNIVKPFV